MADDVIAPPYDVINSKEATQLAKDRPNSFLHISKPEIDLGDDIAYNDPKVYEKGKETLDQMIKDAVLIEDSEDMLYLYEMIGNDIRQLGIAAVGSVDAYEQEAIKRHELTKPDKELDRVNNISSLNAQTGPVLLTYPDNEGLSILMEKIVGRETPIYDVKAIDGVIHRVYQVSQSNEQEQILSCVNKMDALFIADGHHRSAAAGIVKKKRELENTNHTGQESYNYFLTVSFPESEMNILDYNRLIKNTVKVTIDEVMRKLDEHFEVALVEDAYKPYANNHFGMYTNNQWYSLRLRDLKIKEDPVKALDVSMLHNLILEPVFGIGDERTDPNIDFVGGARGMEGLELRVDSKEMDFAFSLYPTPIKALIDVANSGMIMPPKSTWFEPKLLDGLLSHRID
jgi:uncharacterized protein (DUF1015 family)|tara:strand:+ start:188 stop:1384 length:1197 start_codon:yes stop_codon:yes gene_type:complete